MRSVLVRLASFIALTAFVTADARLSAAQPGEPRISVRMQPSNVTRAGLFPFGGGTKMKKGALTVGGETFDIYLPEQKSYSVKNRNDDDSDLRNTSTRLAVDADRDGELSKSESWFANLPVRIGDRMFDVKAIASDGSRVELALSRKPLAGAIVGRKCPPFSYKTLDGKTVTRESLKGKAFVLDIWSPT